MNNKKSKRKKRRKVRKYKARAPAIPAVLQPLFVAIDSRLQEYTQRRVQLTAQVGQLDQGILALQSLKELPHATLATIQALGPGAQSQVGGRKQAAKTLQSLVPMSVPLMAGVPQVSTVQGAVLNIVQTNPGLAGNQLLSLAKSTGNPALRGVVQATISSALNALARKGQVKYTGTGRHGTWNAC